MTKILYAIGIHVCYDIPIEQFLFHWKKSYASTSQWILQAQKSTPALGAKMLRVFQEGRQAQPMCGAFVATWGCSSHLNVQGSTMHLNISCIILTYLSAFILLPTDNIFASHHFVFVFGIIPADILFFGGRSSVKLKNFHEQWRSGNSSVRWPYVLVRWRMLDLFGHDCGSHAFQRDVKVVCYLLG